MSFVATSFAYTHSDLTGLVDRLTFQVKTSVSNLTDANTLHSTEYQFRRKATDVIETNLLELQLSNDQSPKAVFKAAKKTTEELQSSLMEIGQLSRFEKRQVFFIVFIF